MNSAYYRLALGDFDCTSLSDGSVDYPLKSFFANVPIEQVEEALREIKMTPRREKAEPEPSDGFWAAHKRLILTIASGLLTVAGFLLSLTAANPGATIPLYVAAISSGGWLVARKGFQYCLQALGSHLGPAQDQIETLTQVGDGGVTSFASQAR